MTLTLTFTNSPFSKFSILNFMGTIVAISTPAGIGGVALIRVSGPESVSIVTQFTSCKVLKPRHATFAAFNNPDGTLLDEVVITYFAAPHSYTGEDVVEIACHGSQYIQQTLLQLLLDGGARMAEPGEYTKRAFLNGKMDLSQSEAVADLIASTNASMHRLAVSQLRGGYAATLATLREQFVELTSLLELELDFSDEEVEFADRSKLQALLEQVMMVCTRLVDSFQMGNAIKNGVPVAIVGKPNVGKSTLLNALLEDNRAIVSDIPGTTRDTIEDTLTLDGVTFRFIDTAGIRHSDDVIESVGIERSYQAAQKARIILYLVDAREQEIESELAAFEQQVPLEGKTLLLLANKSDLLDHDPHSQFSILNSQFDKFSILNSQFKGSQSIQICAKSGEGLLELKNKLVALVKSGAEDANTQIVTNVRHYEALKQVLAACRQVRESMSQGIPADLIIIDLREALYHLGAITGQVTSDEILGSIFSRFCIGK